MSNKIKLGKIYKRIRDFKLSEEAAYPEYIIAIRIQDRLIDQNRYRFFDVKKGKESVYIIRQRIIEQYYDLVENE